VASLLVRGFALGFAIAASPGPIFFLCLRRTLVRGWLTGLVSGFGVATADGFYAAIAVFGIGAIAATFSGGARWLELVGGVALIVLGLRAFMERPGDQQASAPATGAGLAWAYASTLGLTISNPATIISFAALAAALGAGLSGGFARPAATVIGVTLGSASWWCLLAALTAVMRTRITPSVAHAIGMVSGLAIAGLGALALAAALSH
jgi:threonine/homoserine/homoserine lactone efflux protein